jgi:tagatose 6-phosphate kinase
MILCIGATPAFQRVMVFDSLAIDAVNRAAMTCDGSAGKSINVAKVLTQLGEAPLAAGLLGGERGRFIRDEFTRRGIAHEFIDVPPPTRQCITVIDRAAGTHTELVEESQPVPPECYERLLAIAERKLADDCVAMVLSGTLTPSAPADFYRRCLDLANARGLLTAVDAQRQPLELALPARPGLVKPNRPELAATVGRGLPDDHAVCQAMRELHDRGAQRVVVTAGRRPTLVFDGREWWKVTPPQIQALNPIGSGDAATAAIVMHLLRGDDLGESCRWGCAAGAANALTWMPGELTRSEVDRLAVEVTLERIRN